LYLFEALLMRRLFAASLRNIVNASNPTNAGAGK
jgi:hypothetical protein